MATKLDTKELSIAAAKSFIASLNAADTNAEKKSTILYTVIGKNSNFVSEPTPDDINETNNYVNVTVYDDAIGAKKIETTHVSHVAPRHNWETGTVYAMYRNSDKNLYERNFYVVTDDLNVYKCLDNNSGGASIIEPRGYDLSPFTTSDGYTWKYMYSISTGDADKFLTTSYIPVKTISTSDGSVESTRQLEVQNAAVNGAIQIIEVVNSGRNYLQISNGAVVSATSTTVTFSSQEGSPFPSATDSLYNGTSIYLISGTGSGQLRRIIKYDGETKTATVNTAFATIPRNDSRYIISPTITIIGDGTGAKAYSIVGTDGIIANVSMISTGQNYTKAKAFITSNTEVVHGTGATANVILSPVGGHGSDAISELYADKIIINTQVKGTEGTSVNARGYIPANTDFRTISILKDPILKVDVDNVPVPVEVIANTTNAPDTLRLTHRITMSYDAMDGTVVRDPLTVGTTITNLRNYERAVDGDLEFVTELSPIARRTSALRNAIQGANAQIVFIKKDETRDASHYNLYINNVRSYGNYPAFTRDDVILRSTGTTQIGEVVEIKGPEANTYSGEILYSENVNKVTKDLEQIEDIKIILDF